MRGGGGGVVGGRGPNPAPAVKPFSGLTKRIRFVFSFFDKPRDLS